MQRIATILVQGLVGIVIVLYFSCFGLHASFTGALFVMVKLVHNTLAGKDIIGNYYGMTWVEVWYTVRLILISLAFSLIIGLGLAVIHVRLRNKFVSVTLQTISTLLEAIPEPMYVVLLVVLVLFLMERWHLYFLPVFPDGPPTFADSIVPSLAFALPGGFYLERTISLKIEEEVKRRYVATALSKGASRSRLFYRHVLPNGGAILLRQMPVVVSMISSSALFAEFFMNYQGALFQFTSAIGWNMVTGAYRSFEKPFQLPLYQPGLVFMIGALLVIMWVILRILFELLYQMRYGGAYE